MSDFIEIPASVLSFSQRKPVLGVASNDAPYMISSVNDKGKTERCPYYAVWKSMLERCYSEKYQKKNPIYRDCSVCEEWLSFMSFRKWMESQDWKGKELDKDVKIIGNRLYNKDSCVFVTRQVNSILNKREACRGGYKIGVNYHKASGRLVSRCMINGSSEYLGLFDSEEDAHNAYKKRKRKYITDLAMLPENSYIKKYLINHADLLG